MVWDSLWILVQDVPFWTYSFCLCRAMPKLVEWTRALNCIIWWDLAGFAHLKWPMESSWMALSTTTRLENLAFVERKLQGDMQAIWILWCCRLKRQSRFSILCAQKVARWIPCHPDSHIWADDTSDSMCHDCLGVDFSGYFPRCFIQLWSKASPEQVKLIKLCRSMRRCGRSPLSDGFEKVRMSRRPRRPKVSQTFFRRDLCSQMWSPFPSWSRRIVMLAGPFVFRSFISWVLEKSVTCCFTFLSFNITAGEATFPGLKKHWRCFWPWRMLVSSLMRWFSTTSLVAASMTASSSWPRSLWNVWMQWCELSAKHWDFQDLYKEMIASHVKPSVATFSILIRLYAQCVSISMVISCRSLSHEIEDVPGKTVLEKILCRWRQALGWRIRLAPPGADQIF